MSEDERHLSPEDLRSYGRKRGRKVSPRQQRLLAEVLPRVAIDLTAPFASLSIPAPSGRLPAGESEGATLDLPSGRLPGGELESATAPAAGSPQERRRGQETWLEIGFGGAEHLVWQAEHNPDIQFIGCEPFEDGVIKALTAIEDKKLGNIRIHGDDARPVLRWLPENSVSRAFILFPDPWPKRKHLKRRLVSPATLDLLARVMRPGAELRVATDIGDYARTALLAVRSEPRFRWTANGPADWRERSADWPGTRYEAKGLKAGRRCYYFKFVRM
jgi:tRNA (guanine-N7-)-methyltransferase